MIFAIRDDDVNYFTDPEELEAAYSNVWGYCPPTFSVITHVKGNWPFWIKEIYNNRQSVDWTAWKKDDKVSPLDRNEGLVKFLKEKHKSGKLGLSLHAIHHRNGDLLPPPERLNNYIQGAEFFTNRDLTADVRSAVGYLHSHLDLVIKVFTPPQNLMSLRGYRSVVNNGLSIVGAGIPFWKKERSIKGLENMIKVASFKLRNKNLDYPYILNFKRHSELIHHYPLHPTTRPIHLIEKFEAVYRFNGVFVLSTHYHEFETPLVYDSTRKMKDVFFEFMNYVFSKPDIEFNSLFQDYWKLMIDP